MHKTSTQYIWEHKVRIYENIFQTSLPEWIKAIEPKDAIQIITLAIRCRWRLPSLVFIGGEPLQGYQSLWHNQRNHWDLRSKRTGGQP